uniref:DNL-type domain-containing protein n=1 Tax=Angiostrongylus cantonensis TaxID=6313 RepID=A0A0K0CYW7_ANGCA
MLRSFVTSVLRSGYQRTPRPVEQLDFLRSRSFSVDSTQRRLAVQFTCGVCGNQRFQGPNIFSRNSYEKGVVIVRCDRCQNHHIIADNLGWFKDFEVYGKRVVCDS